MVEHWEKQASAIRGDFRVFRVREDIARSPEVGDDHSFFVLESNDWMNIVPVTEDGRIVCVRQYRHGTEEISLEIPGGIIDDGESPLEAAHRELLEETGYEAERIVEIGVVAPNPAIQNNRCHSFLATDVRRVREQALDITEEIDVVLVDPADVPALIAAGTISHALVVAAFYFWDRTSRNGRQ
jgi:8-oxo-dGTP pyrophosphatase MutT (NUDIX family)